MAAKIAAIAKNPPKDYTLSKSYYLIKKKIMGNFDQNRGMHRATCAKCGKTCEVPFKPTGDKPVYCSDCFKSVRGEDSGRGDRHFGRDDKKMYRATCASCGKTCEVPFRPAGDKPVYCSDCFGKSGGKGGEARKPQLNLDQINTKLDKILQLLGSGATVAAVKKAEPVKPAAPKKKEPAKKPAKLAAATKKPAAKKKK